MLQPGRMLSHYRLIEKIGEGGMGEVYRTHDERLDRDVAIKVLPAGTLSDEAVRKRFRKEALTLSKLNHPNIETIYDFDTQEGVDFLVMEYIPGATLSEQLAAGALPEKEIARLGIQLAEGLAAAHDQGVVHRDLKPSNLLVTPDGRLKILDFGLAKLVRPVTETATTRSLSETQATAGTLPYMAPEQLRSEKADPRTDIYAFGVVLYEMATGQRPFREELRTPLTDAILHQPPVPPRAVNARISPDLERITLKCLDKEPETRYQSARELGVDLRRLGGPLPVSPRRGRHGSMGRRLGLAGSGLAIAVAAVAVLVGLDAGGLRQWLSRSLGTGAPPIQSLVVLPLKNLMGDPEQDYFVDGMHEALITELSQIAGLKVISRTSATRYRDTDKAIPQIAREVGVEGVVEGSVLREGEKVRVTVQLIHGPSDRHLWAQSFDRELHGILALHSEVARAIAGEIKLKLAPEGQVRLASAPPVNPAAYEAYLKGRHLLNTGTEAGFQKAVEYFQEAIAMDPDYAMAYAGLAEAYSLLNFWSFRPTYPQALEAANQALEIDDRLGEAYVSRGMVRQYLNWDWSGAEADFKHALELSPGFAMAHSRYSFLLLVLGRHAEAVAEAKLAREIDPVAPRINTGLGMVLCFTQQYDEAIEHFRKAVELFPDYFDLYVHLGECLANKGRSEEAITELQTAMRLSGGDRHALELLGFAYAKAGKRGEALRVLDELEAVSRARLGAVPSGPGGDALEGDRIYFVARIYAAMGENERARELLEQAYAKHAGDLYRLGFEPALDPLRSDPRFQALLRRMNFPE